MQGEEEHNSLLDQKDQVCDSSPFRMSLDTRVVFAFDL